MSTPGGGAKPGSKLERDNEASKLSMHSKFKSTVKKVAVVVGTLNAVAEIAKPTGPSRKGKDEGPHKKGWKASQLHYAGAAGRLDILMPMWKADEEHELDINKVRALIQLRSRA